MKCIFIILIAITPFFGYSQSLSPERVAKIKSATVRITIDSSESEGTGFFINVNGFVMTCWHVIASSIVINQNVVHIRKIFAQFNDGEKIEMALHPLMIGKDLLNAQSYDYCVLIPINKISHPYNFLKIGDFSTANEGEEIYTCGYPLGMYQQFISKGIISTKFIDSSIVYTNKLTGEKRKVYRNVALMDLTLNNGNSGGAIIRIGATTNDDEVIGIADFNINPFGQNAEKIRDTLHINNTHQRGVYSTMGAGGVNFTDAIELLSAAVSNMSNGMSGCISINHFTSDMVSLNPQNTGK